ncbi:MAG: branched-chain-amino-acid transaminase [Verrucomicrobiales bacterium]|nr:branched-chain-amino-acid transaminase [Verrucomicrobiales bacterium]OUU85201.1 MAG: branched-chain-amino-acid transaminase [Verrucomicrobiaceae bacterium TMED76]
MDIYIDGEYFDKKNAKISVFDHGLLYGDGIFEGIRFYEGRVFKLKEHIQRLFISAKAILLEIEMTQDEMEEAVCETIRKNGLTDGYVRLLVTRGVGTLGLSPFACDKSTVIIIADSISLYPDEKYKEGLKLITCSTRRTAPAALSPSVKSLNYLNNVMAKVEAIFADAEEGLMLNEQGFVAECTGDNIFVVRDGKIKTPPSSAGALPGITREVIFQIAENLEVGIEESQMTRYDIYAADECFLTGTAAEVIAAVSLDRRLIGNGKPGPITEKFIESFRNIVGQEGKIISE